MDDTPSDITVDAETLRLTKNVALDRKLLDDTSLWLTVNAALKSGSMDDDKDSVVEIDWLCNNCKDDTSRLTEYVLAEEGTLKVTDWDWL